MSHFYGWVQGGRSRGTRAGHKTTGLTAVAKSHHANVNVHLLYNKATDKDWASVTLTDEKGVFHVLYHGPLDEYRDPRGKLIPIGVTDPS